MKAAIYQKHSRAPRRRFLLFAAALCLLLPLVHGFAPAAMADFGLKPRLNIRVKNPPAEPYYLDILVEQYGQIELQKTPNIVQTEYDQTMLSALYSYADEGWFPLFAGETEGIPLEGSLVGEPKNDGKNDEMIHRFDIPFYPENYRIIIVTKSGLISVSNPQNPTAAKYNIVYDNETGVVSAPLVLLGLLLIVGNLLITLLLEGIVFALFRISWRDNGRVFVSANSITQIFLTITTVFTIFQTGIPLIDTVRMPEELIILLVECTIFALAFKGVSRKKSIVFAVTANLVSWLTAVVVGLLFAAFGIAIT